MKRIFAIFAATMAMLVFTGIAFGQSAAERGKATFLKQQCFRCHGTQGQGGAGARLSPNTPTAAALIKYVRNPSGNMPRYCEKCVSDAELTDIQAYLASIPPPPNVKNVPLLNQ